MRDLLASTARRASAARPIARDALVAIAALAVVAGAECHGRSARVVLPERSIRRAADPAAVLADWRRAGVHGRTLAHFARRPAMDDGPGPDSAANFVYRAVHENLVRRIYHVIPDADWAEVERNLLAVPEAPASGRVFRLQDAGTPIIVSRLVDLPPGTEPVLADVEVDRFSDAELTAIAARLAGAPGSDLVEWYGARPFPAKAPDVDPR
ncbi:MAG TPA: hypothetical protein VF875_16710 [Anaeromyxobacter sp.]